MFKFNLARGDVCVSFFIEVKDIEIENDYLWFNYTIKKDGFDVVTSRYCLDDFDPNHLQESIDDICNYLIDNIEVEIHKPHWKTFSPLMQDCVEGIMQAEHNMYFLEDEGWKKSDIQLFIRECNYIGIPDTCYECHSFDIQNSDPLITIFGGFACYFDLSPTESILKAQIAKDTCEEYEL